MPKLFVPLGILFVLGGLLAWGWYSLPRPAEVPPEPDDPAESVAVSQYEPPSTAGYVGSQACAECHADIAESYKTHPMSRSIERITAETPGHVPPGERAIVGGSHKRYEVEVADGQMRHHLRMFDAEGEEIYDQAVSMEFVMGSGREAKAYLHQRGEMLFQSALNWYSKSGTWDFSPSYHIDDPRRFDRRVTDQCLACHSGRVAPLGRSLNRYQEFVFHEMAVGCENCHGPGADHIAFQVSDPGDEKKDPIVNPALLSPNRRDSVCSQCHLLGEARIPRYGRSDFDFRPGMRFDEIWTLLMSERDTGEEEDASAVSQVQQMHASRCYQESQGRLGCISCHDPHRLPAESERVAFYRNRCLTCHQEAGCSLPTPQRTAENDSCIACHMPSKTTSNISHVAQTDHRVPRRPRKASAGVKSANSAGEGLSFFDNAHTRLEPWEQDRALGLAASLYLAKTGRSLPGPLVRKLDDVLKKVPDDGATLTALGGLALDHQKLDLARDYYERARSVPASEEAATMGLLKIYYLSGQWQKALECADWLIGVDPGNYRAHAMRADVLVQLNRLDEGIDSAEKALRFHPELTEVRELLISLYQKAGLEQKAHEHRQIVRRMKEAQP